MSDGDSHDRRNERTGARRCGNRIEQTAADWIALRENRALTSAEQEALAAWRTADPRHAAIFEELESAFGAFDRLSAYPRKNDAPVDPDFFARKGVFGRRRTVVRTWAGAAAAAAAMAAVWISFVDRPSSPTAMVAQVDRTRLLALPDGSEIELNAGGDIVEHFTATERRVRLVRGEAHFVVTKDASRPFIVEAGGVAVRAVGTAFNVSLEPRGTEVVVTEGAVRVDVSSATTPGVAAADSAPVIAGQRAVVMPTVPAFEGRSNIVVETLASDAMERALAWQTRRFVFDAMPLVEVAARFNRSAAERPNAPRFRIDDPALGALRISGRIRLDGAETFIELLEASVGARVDRQADGTIVVHRAR